MVGADVLGLSYEDEGGRRVPQSVELNKGIGGKWDGFVARLPPRYSLPNLRPKFLVRYSKYSFCMARFIWILGQVLSRLFSYTALRLFLAVGSSHFLSPLYFLTIISSMISEIAESYMDSKSPSKNTSEELARELLIAISNSLPDKILDSDFVPEGKKANGFAKPKGDWDDKFRSELISISYDECPDDKI
ncbi:hypothetical protein VNO77_41047 [Canavalia gladiata]|uniref:Uncharacterized protein n=1 Tax=Canavalia gladiata TaxID=3824 RepID=A0AAN9PSA8_CANGL